jgi:hypothetical protein
VVCGGTTAQMAARTLGKVLRVEWQPRGTRPAAGRKLPPAALLEGVDLVTEGILTLSCAVELLSTIRTVHELPAGEDAGTRLARLLLQADEIHFIVGDAINPQQLADVVRGIPMRQLYVQGLIARLTTLGKQITVEHF